MWTGGLFQIKDVHIIVDLMSKATNIINYFFFSQNKMQSDAMKFMFIRINTRV